MRHPKIASLLVYGIALHAFMAVPSLARASELFWQCTDQCEQNASIENNKPIQKEKNGNISVWWRLNFAVGSSGPLSAEVKTELDCLAGLARDMAVVYFDQPNLAGPVKGFSIDNGWYELSGHRFNDFFMKICPDRPPQG